MPLQRIVGDSLAPLVDLIYPPRCPSCGGSVAEQNGLCVECWSSLVIPSEPACVSCQRPFGETGPKVGAQCAPCLAEPPHHDGIAAATVYNDTSRDLILAFKYGGRIALATMLAKLIAARLPEGRDGDAAPLIIPVPLHRFRLWRRGFNQAALLAKQLAKEGHGTLLVDGLVRRKATPSLGGFGSKRRHSILSGAIAVNPRRDEVIPGQRIILVDDVLTSGATSNACVRALKRAGARSVTVACFARVLSEAEPGSRS